jgi:leucyl/phenylalanyl-tRNA--protein transferase
MSQIIYQLNDNDLTFPSPDLALKDPNGLLAFDGDLSTPRLINAYHDGIFPWYSNGEPIMWWSPDPRAIIPIDNIVINKTLKKVLKRNSFRVTLNHAFEEVIDYCADAPFRKQEATWIVDDMQQAYINLHQQGYAHSIEVWQEQTLVGGLYGVAINGFFSGESMFYTQSNASKVALVALASLLYSIDVRFIDCQLINPFLASMGCIEVSRAQFIKQKQQSLNILPNQDFWQPRAIKLSHLNVQ